MKRVAMLILLLIAGLPSAHADTAAAYRQAIGLAAEGKTASALASLRSIAEVDQSAGVWLQRVQAARILIRMRSDHSTLFPPQSGPNSYLALASTYALAHPLLMEHPGWPATLLASILPGAGHAWQGRWHDAGTAALMVWPMLLLTIWAFRRRMGPVTLFFALITIWLWSGTVFSSMSLAWRGDTELYLGWWQGIWQASGLPGRPW